MKYYTILAEQISFRETDVAKISTLEKPEFFTFVSIAYRFQICLS